MRRKGPDHHPQNDPEFLIEQVEIKWLFGNSSEEYVDPASLKHKLAEVLDNKKSMYFAIIKPLEIVVGRPYLYKELVRQEKKYSLMYLYKNPKVTKSCGDMDLEELEANLNYKKSEQETQKSLSEIFETPISEERAEELRRKVYKRVAKLVFETIHS